MRTRTTIVLLVALTAAAAALPAAHATFRGANGRIAFPMGSGNVDIYTTLPDGTDLKRLTTAAGFDGCAAWSPNGKQIAFCSQRSGRYQIWLMNADGSGKRQVTQSHYPALFPAFSADGRRIAFQADNGSPAQDDIYVVAVGGGKITRLTGAPGNDDYPAFSPDGKTIAFVSHRKIGPGQIWSMNADGSDQRALTRDTVSKDELPDWSPNGKQIAYEGDGNIWVMNADGSGQHAVTHGHAYDFGPAWSPDGKQIVFLRAIGPVKRVYVMNADGSGLHKLRDSIVHGIPAWQPLP